MQEICPSGSEGGVAQPNALSLPLYGARTLWGRLFSRTWETNGSRKSLRWDWRLEANLNRKANGSALEGPSVGLYVPLLEFNMLCSRPGNLSFVICYSRLWNSGIFDTSSPWPRPKTSRAPR
jgi:hypothetical protein